MGGSSTEAAGTASGAVAKLFKAHDTAGHFHQLHALLQLRHTWNIAVHTQLGSVHATCNSQPRIQLRFLPSLCLRYARERETQTLRAAGSWQGV